MIKIYVTCENKNNLITTIPFKGVKVQVEFTGGNVMKNLPAKFYCSDPFTQKALDESDQRGRLYRLSQVIPEDSDGNAAEAKPAGEAFGTQLARPASETSVREGSVAFDAVDMAGEKLEFDNLSDAVTYIAAHYGEQVESESQVRKFIEEKEGRKCLIHKG